MALNEDKAFNSTGMEGRFSGGKAEKKMLKAGMWLYKFSTYGYPLSNGGSLPEWWSPVEPLGNADVGLKGVLDFAKKMKVSSKEYARVIAAVTKDKNEMNGIAKVQLKENIWGFWGQCSAQPKSKGGKLGNFPGTAWQLYIPNLKKDHIKDTKEIAAP